MDLLPHALGKAPQALHCAEGGQIIAVATEGIDDLLENVSSGSVSSVTTNAAACARVLTIRRDTEGVTDVAGERSSLL